MTTSSPDRTAAALALVIAAFYGFALGAALGMWWFA